MIKRRNWWLCTDLLAFTLRLRKTPESFNRRLSVEGCAFIHRLKWSPLPPNNVCMIAQNVVEEDGRKG
jgi:hypothetical protein